MSVAIHCGVVTIPSDLVLRDGRDGNDRVLCVCGDGALKHGTSDGVGAKLCAFGLRRMVFLAQSVRPYQARSRVQRVELIARVVLHFRLTLSVVYVKRLEVVRESETRYFLISAPMTTRTTRRGGFLELTAQYNGYLSRINHVLNVSAVGISFVGHLHRSNVVSRVVPEAVLASGVDRLNNRQLAIKVFRISGAGPFVLRVGTTAYQASAYPNFVSPIGHLLRRRATGGTANPHGRCLFRGYRLSVLLGMVDVMVRRRASPVRCSGDRCPGGLLSTASREVLPRHDGTRGGGDSADGVSSFQ